MKKRPTITDVANAAGVSLMSVSRAMNNKPGLSEETRQRILDIANEIGYRPNQIARGLVTRETFTIGLVVPDVSNPFFAQIARGVEDAAYKNGYSVFLINTAEDIDREKFALDMLWQKEIDGAVLCSPRLSLEELKPYLIRLPATVLVNRQLDTPLINVATINVDDRFGAQQAIQYFAKNGRKRIACIAGPVTSISSQRRIDGYRFGLKASERKYDPTLVEHCLPTTEGGHTAAQILFSHSPNVDAILCFNDLVAIGVMRACSEHGWNVPTDVAVIGADDIPLAALVHPKLSSLDVDQYEIGQKANSLLIDLIKNEPMATHAISLKPKLVLREST